MWSPNYRDTWLNLIDVKDDYLIIDDCIVDYETGLVLKDGEIVWEASNELLVWHKNWITSDPRWGDRVTRFELILERMKEINYNIKQKLNNLSNEPVQIDSNLTLHLLHPFNRYVYGHFYDTMQKLSIACKMDAIIDSVLLSRTHEISDIQTHLNVLLNNGVVRSADDTLGFVKVKKLLYINPPAHPTNFTKESYTFIRQKYFNFFNIDENIDPSKKLFLTRREGQSKRYIKNSNYIENNLKSQGVVVLDGTESLKEIVSAFSSASHIAGIHGALFMNNIFCNKQSIFREYCPISRNTRTFYDQYKLCKNYDHILIDCDENYNVDLSLSDLKQFYDNY